MDRSDISNFEMISALSRAIKKGPETRRQLNHRVASVKKKINRLRDFADLKHGRVHYKVHAQADALEEALKEATS